MHSLQVVSIEKAANILDVSRSSVRRLIKSRMLPAVKIGGQLRIRVVDLLTLIEKDRNSDDRE
jgi:excisionase family DNA binding protein